MTFLPDDLRRVQAASFSTQPVFPSIIVPATKKKFEAQSAVELQEEVGEPFGNCLDLWINWC